MSWVFTTLGYVALGAALTLAVVIAVITALWLLNSFLAGLR